MRYSILFFVFVCHSVIDSCIIRNDNNISKTYGKYYHSNIALSSLNLLAAGLRWQWRIKIIMKNVFYVTDSSTIIRRGNHCKNLFIVVPICKIIY